MPGSRSGPAIGERREVFQAPQWPEQGDFNTVLRRYLLVQRFPTTEMPGRLDTQRRTARRSTMHPSRGAVDDRLHTEHWDVGPGDSASFPSKWISADGKTLHLVFSGNDSFSVRRVTLVVGP
jgi:hypothetical protein